MIRYLRFVINVSNWWLHLAVKMGLTAKDPLLFETRNRILIEVPRRLFREFKEIFIEDCYRVGSTGGIPEHPIVVDIGANVGFFSLFAASRFPGVRIFAYEPVPKNFSQLTRNQDLNRHVEMTCIPKAVYSYSGDVRLELDPYGSSGEGTPGLDPHDRFTTGARVTSETSSPYATLQVPCATLSDLLDTHGISECYLLKMDCEGAEFDILYSCPEAHLHRIEQMAIEVHRGGATPERTIKGLSRFLESCGFHTRCFDDILLGWRSKAPRSFF